MGLRFDNNIHTFLSFKEWAFKGICAGWFSKHFNQD